MFKQAKTTSVKATSRASVKIKDCYYTFEFEEELDTKNIKESNLQQEKDMLWERVHSEVDKQIRQVVGG